MGGTPIRVFSVAKTVADCFRYRNKIGLDVAMEALQEVVRTRRASPAQIMEFARVDKVESAYQPLSDGVLLAAVTPTNLPASIRARLRNKADELGLSFDQVLQYYAMERFLFRLSKTRWADALIVKGAAMLRVWDGTVARPTRDIDFLGRIDNTPEAISAMVEECLSIDSDDGIEFSAEVTVEPITIEDRYPGARAVIQGALSGARIRLQLDIGVADVAVPDPGWVDYPTRPNTGNRRQHPAGPARRPRSR